MGACAEICAENHTESRKEQDDYASQSSERVFPAFAWEIVSVEVSGGRGKPPTIVDKDDGLGKFDVGKLPKLRPTFKENGGTVNARNSSSLRCMQPKHSSKIMSSSTELPKYVGQSQTPPTLGFPYGLQ
ncbi:acetyl-CoA acetyltransferase, cytosolic 1 [Morus notabilis]|uniref:acetyl-CoA acetyltransferase, cytosolic 1 n=1 Tax=Morus notabilis TaxID=981085 RepID=UPI000CED330E|nr:acetyl-CoA acetyltransferase, cytosolic 1 [Morus notabilis]